MAASLSSIPWRMISIPSSATRIFTMCELRMRDQAEAVARLLPEPDAHARRGRGTAWSRSPGCRGRCRRRSARRPRRRGSARSAGSAVEDRRKAMRSGSWVFEDLRPVSDLGLRSKTIRPRDVSPILVYPRSSALRGSRRVRFANDQRFDGAVAPQTGLSWGFGRSGQGLPSAAVPTTSVMSIRPTGLPSASTTGSSLIFRSAMIATASDHHRPRPAPCSGRLVITCADRAVQLVVAAPLEQPGQVAVGEDARQPALPRRPA